jgi:hypothetical protein
MTLLKNIFKDCKVSEDNIEKIITDILEHKYVRSEIKKGYFNRPLMSCSRNDDDCGQLLQIFINKTHIDEFVYNSEPYGKDNKKSKYCSTIKEQVRIVPFPKYFMDPNFVKIYRYAANETLHKNRLEYITFIKDILNKTVFNIDGKKEEVKQLLGLT